jgi:hypothetical protein
MNCHTTTRVRRLPVTGPRLTARLRAALTTLSDSAHDAADARAQAAGWTATPIPGPLGLDGRTYRDPRFTTRQAAASRTRPTPGQPR